MLHKGHATVLMEEDKVVGLLEKVVMMAEVMDLVERMETVVILEVVLEMVVHLEEKPAKVGSLEI